MQDEIIKTFLKSGMLLSRKALEDATRLADIEGTIKKLPKTLVVESLEMPAQERAEPVKESGNKFTQFVAKPETSNNFIPKVTLLKTFQPTEKSSVTEMIKRNAERFESLRKILSDKFELENLTTINKLNSFGEASIIGEVRSVEEKVVQIEDTTGSVKVLFDEPQKVLVGDVVGAHGAVRKDFLVSKKITFPDVPLRRSVSVAAREVTILIASASEKNRRQLEALVREKNFNYLPNCGGVEISVPGAIGNGKNPGEIFEVEGVNVAKLVFDEKFLAFGEDALLECLKRRSVRIGMENFLIESPPDIMVAEGKPSMKNYKGSTLLQCSEGTAFTLNLQTREVQEINLMV